MFVKVKAALVEMLCPAGGPCKGRVHYIFLFTDKKLIFVNVNFKMDDVYPPSPVV